MQRLSPGQRAGGDRGEHIAGAVLAAGNLSGPIGEQTAAEHACPAGIAGIPGDAGNDHTSGTHAAEGIGHFDEIIAVAGFPIGHAGEEGCFRYIGKQIIAPAAQLSHGFHMLRRDTGVELAVVTHHRIDDFQTVKFIQHTADCFRLLRIGEITGGDGIKLTAHGCHVIGKGGDVFCHRLYNRIRESCVGGENRRGQHAGADTHGRQNGQRNSEAAFTHAGQVLYRENLHKDDPSFLLYNGRA